MAQSQLPFLRLRGQLRLGRAMRHRPYICVAILVALVFLVSHVRPSLNFFLHTLGTGEQQVWDERALQVKAAFLHAYHGYELFAEGHDELAPLSSGHKDPFSGWGVTAVDSLDTMLIMDLDAEFSRASSRIAKLTFPMEQGEFTPYFETVIRYLGGFLSAYAMTNDRIFLDLADDLAIRLDPAFGNWSSVFPVFGVNTRDGHVTGSEIGGLAEMATMQVEYMYLAKATGKKHWYDRAAGVISALASADLRSTGGMLPTKWNLTSGQPFDCEYMSAPPVALPNGGSYRCLAHLGVGGQADSTHEYLLKQYLLTSKTDKESLRMYLRTSTHILANLLYVTPERNLLYVTDTTSTTDDHPGCPSHKMEHLACFLPGLLALGAHSLPLDKLVKELPELGKDFGWASRGYNILSQEPSLRELHLWAAKGLAETCFMMYADEESGLSPEQLIFQVKDRRWGKLQNGSWVDGGGRRWIDEVKNWRHRLGMGLGRFKYRRFPPGVEEKLEPIVYSKDQRQRGSGKGRDYSIKQTAYLLRPETVESLYILWRVTGERRWREMGWTIFQAIERETRTAAGYAAIKSAEMSPAVQMDDMPSYFLAETLKYLYLLFTKDDLFPLDKWVFNTEAHPLPIFEWTAEEKLKFGII
ncbi:unnamed protein product [Mycena citricolor]|uniref:alpha-1,2-Mannosidase n=1 Tax=Mycena citricolor TaxID=2018698 RepID=A0AAD2Q225_9AGAR|nr:unnamed protein product [Mycena citricolor]